MQQLLHGKKYGERRGAAYGLASIAKACGMKTLKTENVLDKVTHALESKVS